MGIMTWEQATKFDLKNALEYSKYIDMPDMSGKKILDFGCGGGRDCLAFARMGAEVYGVDILESNLDYARKLLEKEGFKGNFKLVKEKDDIPFPDDFFDFVNCNGVLHHIPHDTHVVSEMSRVLKTGGRVFLMVYAPWLFKHRIDQVFNMVANDSNLTWQNAFGEITDKCDYSNFYTIHEIGLIFNGYKLNQAAEFRGGEFTIYQLEKHDRSNRVR